MMAVTASIGEDVLLGQIVADFLPRFTTDGILRYVVGKGWARQNPDRINDLGLTPKSRRRMPDVLIHQPNIKRLVLIDALTSQGVMTPARRDELSQLYFRPAVELVFATVFPSRESLSSAAEEIAWETVVWIANEPDHIIHFNGDKSLRPYGSGPEVRGQDA